MTSEIDSAELEKIERVKSESVGQLLFKCARLFNELGLARVRAYTGQNFRNSHAQLFPHIDFHGTRLTELAKRLGVSKQAAGQLVTELEGMGSLERVPDPNDGRAKLIRFSASGRNGILDGLGVLLELEKEFAQDLTQERMDTLREGLTLLLGALETKES